MALTKAAQEELDAYKAALDAKYGALMAAENPQPQLPTVQELELPDVLRILVQHSRVPLESLQLAMLAAIDRAFAPVDDVETEEVPA